jgi:2-oxo-4-hydroxy-4-carboxy-5-ureidoimidazoline decarboxylase
MSKTASELSALPVADFVAAIGSVYEKTPWIAEKAHAAGPYDSLAALAAGLKKVVTDAGTDAQLALLRAHPDLAGKAALAGQLTSESTEEQARAGLGSLTPEEMTRFVALNEAYKAKFGFPFVLAVRNARKTTILGAFEARLGNTVSGELAEGITQVHKIAWMRLRALVQPNPTGFLTCHVSIGPSRPSCQAAQLLKHHHCESLTQPYAPTHACVAGARHGARLPGRRHGHHPLSSQ